MKTNYIFPAVFIYEESGISILFPDLDGCVSFGKDEEQALSNAKECLSLHLFAMEQDNDPIPTPTSPKDIELQKNEVAVLIDVNMTIFRDKMNNRAIKKTLTVPSWLNTLAQRQNVNFSQVLQEALKQHLGI